MPIRGQPLSILRFSSSPVPFLSLEIDALRQCAHPCPETNRVSIVTEGTADSAQDSKAASWIAGFHAPSRDGLIRLPVIFGDWPDSTFTNLTRGRLFCRHPPQRLLRRLPAAVIRFLMGAFPSHVDLALARESSLHVSIIPIAIAGIVAPGIVPGETAVQTAQNTIPPLLPAGLSVRNS